MKIDYSRLYWMRENHSLGGRALRAGPANNTHIEQADHLLRGLLQPRTAMPFERRSGKRLCDVIWTTMMLPLVSRHFISLLKKEQFGKWATYPITLKDQEGGPIDHYVGFAVLGRSAPIDYFRCQIEMRDPIVPGLPKNEWAIGLYIKDDQWDGSDIFVPDDSGYIIVTEQVRCALMELNIPNVEFDRLEQYGRLLTSANRDKYTAK